MTGGGGLACSARMWHDLMSCNDQCFGCWFLFQSVFASCGCLTFMIPQNAASGRDGRPSSRSAYSTATCAVSSCLPASSLVLGPGVSYLHACRGTSARRFNNASILGCAHMDNCKQIGDATNDKRPTCHGMQTPPASLTADHHPRRCTPTPTRSPSYDSLNSFISAPSSISASLCTRLPCTPSSTSLTKLSIYSTSLPTNVTVFRLFPHRG